MYDWYVCARARVRACVCLCVSKVAAVHMERLLCVDTQNPCLIHRGMKKETPCMFCMCPWYGWRAFISRPPDGHTTKKYQYTQYPAPYVHVQYANTTSRSPTRQGELG